MVMLIESTILDFPQVRQSNEYSCGARVATASPNTFCGP